MNKSELDIIKEHIKIAEEAKTKEFTVMLALEDAKELVRLFETYSVEIIRPAS